ncbi:anaphase-promoting complex subunit 6-like isoform X1 [Hibiscus syriacus]|uniref:Anaphase-promoting complex subunit 6-like isoform X1 n=1 Tax=Hibiscus syriacus TaxID=106335 RepID=A0A6A3BZ28_HIBSY|nr:anaphase-promoting complex subunit 6-like isoform X1 [Hibiscus syriacus]
MASSSFILFCFSLYYFFFLSCASQATTKFKGIDLGSTTAALDVYPTPLYGHSSVRSSKDVILCDRVQLSGHSRLKLRSYADSVRVTLAPSVLIPERLHRKIQVCFHRNASLGLCQCEHENWRSVENGIWNVVMSPYDDRFVDVKFLGDVSGSITVTVEEGIQRWRLVFLALGFVLLLLAPIVSKWVPFYYSSSMAIGVILVILILLFQGMKLLPAGRTNIFYLSIYVPLGAGSFLLHQLSGLVNSILINFGLSEDMHNPVAIFVLVGIFLSGAALGYWMVRKFVISKDGIVDVGVAEFVKWAMRIIASALIFQSTLDTWLALAALVSSSAICFFITSTRRKSHLHQPHSWDRSPWVHRSRQGMINQGRAEFFNRAPRMYSDRKMWNRHTPTTSLAWTRFPARGTFAFQGGMNDREYYSTFHKTRNRKKFTKQEWEDFSRESTRDAMAELTATPEFTDWMIEHADRIKLLPCESSEESVGSKSCSSDYEEERSSGGFRLFNL